MFPRFLDGLILPAQIWECLDNLALKHTVISKIFERFWNNVLIGHPKKLILSSNCHCGFRSFGWTKDLLRVLFDRIARLTVRSEAIQTTAIDISKAFGKLFHTGVLHKLKIYHIPDQFGLDSSFLTNRKLRVVVNGMFSQDHPSNADAVQDFFFSRTVLLPFL